MTRITISAREKKFITIGVGLLGAFLFLQLALFPLLQRNRELTRLIPQKELELREVRRLQEELRALRETRAAIVKRVPAQEKALSPLPKLEGLIERSDLRQNLRSIKPAPFGAGGEEATLVELILEKADLPHLTRFLYEIQSSPGARLMRMSLKPRYTTPRDLDSNLQIVFYQG
ncbi:MAG: type II secretion system protein M [Deltaproteobacteria bacterium]|nr:type II secretion system protein M [Deltaproteobacteria bacterium]